MILAKNDVRLIFNIPKKTAFLSLSKFAVQADVIFTFTMSFIENVEANLVASKYTSSEALDCCLKATELEVISNEKGKISIF